MTTTRQAIAAVGGNTKMAAAVRAVLPGSRINSKDVHNWRRRSSIPTAYIRAVDSILADLGRHDLITLLVREREARAVRSAA